MSEFAFQPSVLPSTLSDSELQTLAERFLKRPRTLQELPLILVTPAFLNSLPDQWIYSPAGKAALQTWLEQARLEDERLRIERRLIPHTPIYLPHTPEGQQFFQLAKAISDIPLNTPIVPKNQNQGLWFKTLHYYWQAKGVVLAHRLLGVIADPLGKDGMLTDRLSNRNLEYLRSSSETEIACFRLLRQGERYIQQWAEDHEVDYPFETPVDLLLQLLREEFRVGWQLGPDNAEKEALSKTQQRNHFSAWVRLLKQLPWLEGTGQRPSYSIVKQEYLQYLDQADWSGYWLLALLPHQCKQQIEPLWKAYIQSLVKSKEHYVDTLDWLKGEPWYRPTSNVHLPVKGSLNLLGYIEWILA